jgi:hypothetical protein
MRDGSERLTACMYVLRTSVPLSIACVRYGAVCNQQLKEPVGKEKRVCLGGSVCSRAV